MWDDWACSIKPDLHRYKKMVGPIELAVTLKHIPSSSGDEWFVYFDGWSTLADSGGPYFADSFDDLASAQSVAFRAACERVGLLEASQSYGHASADDPAAREAFGGNFWKLRNEILPQARKSRQNGDAAQAIAAYRLALGTVERYSQALRQCRNYFSAYYPANSIFEEYMAEAVSIRSEVERALNELGAPE